MSDNQLSICNGVNLGWRKGSIKKDLGYSQVGTTLETTEDITGLHNFRQSATVQKILATVNNTGGTNLTLQYDNAGTWTVISVGATYNGFEDCKTYMEDFIGYCFIVGYDSTDNVFLPSASLTGTTFSEITNVTNMPEAKFIKRYRDRLYIANCDIAATRYPFRIYYSSVPTAGAITWTTASDFVDLDYGEAITGIGSNWDKLVAFTEFKMYTYDQTNLTMIGDIGCINGDTIQNLGSYLIWADKENVWASTGGRATPIANDIKELLRNATPSAWLGATVNREYHLYLGSTSANGLTYSNCLATFDATLGYWRWRELGESFTALARYTSGSEDFLYMGAADGEVHVKSKYTDTTPIYADDGVPITSHFRMKAFDFGDPSVDKTIAKIIAYAEDAQQLTLRFRVWNRNNEVVMPFDDIGKLGAVITEFKDTGITGRFIEIEGKEYSSNAPFEFYGLTLLLGGDSNI